MALAFHIVCASLSSGAPGHLLRNVNELQSSHCAQTPGWQGWEGDSVAERKSPTAWQDRVAEMF